VTNMPRRAAIEDFHLHLPWDSGKLGSKSLRFGAIAGIKKNGFAVVPDKRRETPVENRASSSGPG